MNPISSAPPPRSTNSSRTPDRDRGVNYTELSSHRACTGALSPRVTVRLLRPVTTPPKVAASRQLSDVSHRVRDRQERSWLERSLSDSTRMCRSTLVVPGYPDATNHLCRRRSWHHRGARRAHKRHLANRVNRGMWTDEKQRAHSSLQPARTWGGWGVLSRNALKIAALSN